MRTRRFRLNFGRRRGRDAQVPSEMSVTLSVLPTRTAVVVLDVGADAASTTLAGLVDHAVHDAFVFDAVDVVEVRRRNGELLERRSRGGLLSA
ncbi:MAG: hypothetical protein LC792_05285 [Actinobacteria bacterium]|nr:hypothetical protein [Actinomycetota bacterium]